MEFIDVTKRCSVVQIKQTTRRLGIIKKCAGKAKFHIYVSRSVIFGGYALPFSNQCAGGGTKIVVIITVINMYDIS